MCTAIRHYSYKDNKHLTIDKIQQKNLTLDVYLTTTIPNLFEFAVSLEQNSEIHSKRMLIFRSLDINPNWKIVSHIRNIRDFTHFREKYKLQTPALQFSFIFLLTEFNLLIHLSRLSCYTLVGDSRSIKVLYSTKQHSKIMRIIYQFE